MMDTLTKYTPADEEEMFDMLNVLDDRLNHANSGVVMGAVRLFLHLTKDCMEMHEDVYERIKSGWGLAHVVDVEILRRLIFKFYPLPSLPSLPSPPSPPLPFPRSPPSLPPSLPSSSLARPTPDLPWWRQPRAGLHLPAAPSAAGGTAERLAAATVQVLLLSVSTPQWDWQCPVQRLHLHTHTHMPSSSSSSLSFNDPPYLKIKKIEILIELASPENGKDIVEEMGSVNPSPHIPHPPATPPHTPHPPATPPRTPHPTPSGSTPLM